MATLLSITNRILRRLREDQVTETNATTYSTMIADFVAEAYEEVADEWDWASLRHEIAVDVVAAQAVYDIGASTDTGGDVRNTYTRFCKHDSFLDWDEKSGRPSIRRFDSTSDDDGDYMHVVSPSELDRIKSYDRDDTDDDPWYVTFYPDATGQKLTMEVFPIPATTREIVAHFYTKPDELELDASDDATVLLVPDRPVYALALMWAYNERGEELGEPGNLAERRYMNALAAAKEADARIRERTGQLDWRRC